MSSDPSALVRSWERSQAALGEPQNVVEVPHVPEGVLDEHLLEMFAAPLNRFAHDLEGTGLGLLLADSRGQILQRWYEDRKAMVLFDRVGTVRGAVLAENVVGTNGVGTVVATGRATQVRGEEHFAEFYRDVICTGSPVLHPITGKLMAVITLSSDLTPRSDLLMPLVRSVTTQLEQQLLALEHPASRATLSAFMNITRRQGDPVVAFGPQGIMLQSASARQISETDKTLLHQLTAETRPDGRYALELSSGRADIEIQNIGAGNSIVTVSETPPRSQHLAIPRPAQRLVGRSPEWLELVNKVEHLRDRREPVILVGEPGAGKTSLALGAPSKSGVVSSATALVDAAESHILGTRHWLGTLSDALSSGARNVVVRGIDTLDAPAVDGTRALLEAKGGAVTVIMTLSAESLADSESLRLKFGSIALWVPPLRDRLGDLEELWDALALAVAPSARLKLAPDALAALRRHDWPGNVKELRQLITQLSSAGKTGLLSATDLPMTMQSQKNLSLIERVELEAIRKALAEANGNRVLAADILGVSRATVYRKIKAYRLDSA